LEGKNDLVSVVLPVFNSEKFLKKAVESILNQTYSNLEIFAIDDGSEDNSLEILNQYSDEINVISQSNLGLGDVLKNGIQRIRGKWFKWFSPDDILYPDAIGILVDTAKKLSEDTIVYSNWEIIDENNHKLRNFSESNYNDLTSFDYNVRLLDGQQINVNTTLIPTHLFERGCLIQKLEDPVTIDYDFFLRAGILFDTHFHLISQPLIQYRINSSQLSKKNITKTLSYLDEVRDQILSKLDKTKKEQYLDSLKEYQSKKSLFRKTMELGLNLATYSLPDEVTDKLLVFYLNKIRRTR